MTDWDRTEYRVPKPRILGEQPLLQFDERIQEPIGSTRAVLFGLAIGCLVVAGLVAWLSRLL